MLKQIMLLTIGAVSFIIGCHSTVFLSPDDQNYQKLEALKQQIKKQNENLEEKERKINETKKAIENYIMVKKENNKIIKKLRQRK